MSRMVPSHTESRFEYRFPGVTEAYDLRGDGVEQTFVIAARPRSPGDLVVEGRIETELSPVAATVPASHAELVYADRQGNPIVKYGKAFAIDALGNRTEVTTSLSGSTVRLCVPGAWLSEAMFPVTI